MNIQRNLVAAVLLSALILFGWDFALSRLYPPQASLERTGKIDVPTERRVPAGELAQGTGLDPVLVHEEVDLETALMTGRLDIDAPTVAGSINPVGARVDDIMLKTHRQTVDEDSGPVRLFSPDGTSMQQFAQFGWVGEGVILPGATTLWEVQGGPLTQTSPVTLTWENGQGQLFTLRFAIDEFYMLTVEQTVANTGDAPIAPRPYAFINRTSRTASPDMWNVHSGPIGQFGGSVDFSTNYKDVDADGAITPAGRTGWVGFTDLYWLSVLVPEDGAAAESTFRSLGNSVYRADLIYDPVTVPAGQELTRTTRLFAGAKESTVLNHYQDTGVENFGLAIDWGWFRWFMYPIFWLLRQLYALTGNFGVAIILLTVVVRAAVFPIAQRGFASMAQMRAVQPKMKALQERYKEDKSKLQQEMAELYKDEKINPLAGCLPLLLQVPIFFALYKVLLIAIEMRHKPFVLWIEDLSAPDPATILNLFGLLPFTPPSFLAIGVLAVLIGVTMWLQFRFNPQAMDPVQQQIFMIMPWVLMFGMAHFAAGLLLYWITSNILTLAQQTYLYSRHPQLKQLIAPSDEPHRVDDIR